jgi:hypothetical protein
MIITAKYTSTCPACGQPCLPGQPVNWRKGAKATHEKCGSAAAPQRSNRRRNSGVHAEDCRKYGWDGVRGSSSYYTSGQYDEES